MKKATISQTKNQLSALLDAVRHGETILITDRNRPVARLEPVGAVGSEEADGLLARLERAGLLRLGRGRLVESIVKEPPPRPGKGVSAVRALLEERNFGR
jgi:prevent-host-death family protein